MVRPIETKERRKSFLDIGGPNSLNNFASSYARTQSYLTRSLGGEELDGDQSPLTSPLPQPTYAPNDVESNPLYLDEDPADSSSSSNSNCNRGVNSNFQFPRKSVGSIDESSHLLLPTASVNSTLHGHGNFEGSTGPQTIFNSINTMMGIGMLSLPLGFKLSGWVLGSAILVLCALSTNYTAKLLGRILKVHPHLRSYSDVAHLCYGGSVNFIISSIFMADLIGATASLVLLFGDSLAILLPSTNTNVFKTIIVLITFVSSFLPLSVLSMTSFLGIMSTTGIVLIIVFCGLITGDAEGLGGSLLEPAVTYLWPQEWKNLLLSLGIFMAPWGGHVVFPELYRDMRHPAKYDHCTNITFNFTFLVDYLIAAVGYLMFGLACEDSFTKNLMLQPNFPKWVKPVICLLMGIMALVKAPLMVRPVFSVLEKALSIETITISAIDGTKTELYGFKRICLRIFYCALILYISVTFTSFGGVVAFLGSAICFTICLVLPLTFYLKVFYGELSQLHRVLLIIGAFIGTILAISGTYGAITIDV